MEILLLLTVLVLMMFASRFTAEIFKAYRLRKEEESNTKPVKPVSPLNWYCFFSLDDLIGPPGSLKK